MSALPLFFFPGLQNATGIVDLDEEIKRHAVTVLRMNVGELLLLTDGKGYTCEARIAIATKKQLAVDLLERTAHPAPPKKMVLGISLLKNTARFEWMLEKVTEIGVTEIYPLLCERTERQHFRKDRFAQIITSACLQSQQFHFPILQEPKRLEELFRLDLPTQRFIAHCMDGEKKQLGSVGNDAVLLVGPEGDFTPSELELSIANGFQPVSLGASRLRTETAGIVGAVMMR
jgi:16S rRNA (uracil1498-N3)-methyltransferase